MAAKRLAVAMLVALLALAAATAAYAQTPTPTSTRTATATPTPTPAPTPTPQPDLAAIYRQYVDAINRGDAAGAAAFFTDDGVFIIPGCPADTGCVGRAAIQGRIQSIVNSSRRFTIIEAQVSGNTVSAREEHRAPVVTAAGVERYVFKGTLTFRGDKISRLVYEFDISDPQTVTFVKFLQAQAQPTATSAALPKTGGSPAGSGSEGWLLASLIGLGLVALTSGAWAVSRTRR
jgi:ketosteroid isomerase-like protein